MDDEDVPGLPATMPEATRIPDDEIEDGTEVGDGQ